ncbi:beta-N-acetylhexosaminidase [Uliginosibacterium sp. H1]|uniref:beta-N-acetylhexosaminidase n=1 Tax=Uliginosibacterium sp. H1 TaxID=3114757 RepID=UPI002E1817A2|nr:beta-N-acetylhexosaminidase [Uliginosibacterium sp. H1]
MKAVPVHLPPGPVMCDVAGTRLTDEEREVLRHPLVGGVILFSRNYENPVQVAELCAEIHALRTPHLVIAVDHEGGRVQRFRSGFTRLPTMRALGELWQQDEEAARVRAREVGLVLAGELMALGLDLSFTPVLDLDFGTSGVIGDRAFHRDPRIVAELATALTEGLNQAGMGAVGKHFPGHGFVAADSHFAIPVDERDFDTIWAEDLQPYRHALGGRLAGIMPAHVIYPKVDDRPAGFSPFWLQDVLRGRLGFDGVIFSDDLTMEGATVVGDIVARADAALNAGCDMVLVCNRPDETARLLAGWNPVFPVASAARIERLLPQREGRDFLAGNTAYLAAQRVVADWVSALA